MWFMYLLSWLSLFIQVSFITLAVGESARPRPARASTSASLLTAGRTTRAPERPGDPCPVLPAFASPATVPLVLAPPADPSSLARPWVLPGVAKSLPAAPGSGSQVLRARAPPTAAAPTLGGRLRGTFTGQLPPPFGLRPFQLLTLTLTRFPLPASSYCGSQLRSHLLREALHVRFDGPAVPVLSLK